MAVQVVERIREEKEAYTQGRDRPLGSLAVISATYASLVAVGAWRLRGKPLPEHVNFGDVAVLSVATHKLSRIVAKESVTAPLRAPFTELQGGAGAGEIHERVRGTGLRKAIGELVTCPFCLSVWVATALAFGYVLAPRLTRLTAMVLTAVTGADMLQFAYVRLKDGS